MPSQPDALPKNNGANVPDTAGGLSFTPKDIGYQPVIVIDSRCMTIIAEYARVLWVGRPAVPAASYGAVKQTISFRHYRPRGRCRGRRRVDYRRAAPCAAGHRHLPTMHGFHRFSVRAVGVAVSCLRGLRRFVAFIAPGENAPFVTGVHAARQ